MWYACVSPRRPSFDTCGRTGLGSTSLTTAAGGGLVSQAWYLPYGETRWGGTGPTDFGFTSQRQEAGFGLYDYNARFYSPVLGRFISPDTIVPSFIDPQALNRYSYVRNNPIARRDPSGHCDNWICDFVTAPVQLVQDLASGVSNIGNPEYQMGPQSQEMALDIIKRAIVAPITGDFPDSSDYAVPASEVSQNHTAIGNVAGWTSDSVGDAVNAAGVAGLTQLGVAVARRSISLFAQEAIAYDAARHLHIANLS